MTMVTDTGGPPNLSPPTVKQLRTDKLDILHHLSDGEREPDKSSEGLNQALPLTLPGHVFLFYLIFSLSLSPLSYFLSFSLSFLPPLFPYLSLSFSLAAFPLCSHSRVVEGEEDHMLVLHSSL